MNERIRRRKEELGMTTEALGKLSGVPVGTINKILSGETKSPRCDTVAALEKVLFPEESLGYRYDTGAAGKKGCVRESAAEYLSAGGAEKKQGQYTLADYYALPEDVRAELIDGELIYMEAPSFEHQFFLSELIFLFTAYIKEHHGKCLVLPAPLDVQLDCDDRTMMQPDIVISCEKERRTNRCIYGAPDLAVEITSPSTRKRDYAKKMQKYMDAGVREYWIVDLQKRLVITYFFEEDIIPHVHTFQESIPVSIYGGALAVDFAAIERRLQEI